MEKNKNYGFETKSIHAGEEKKHPKNALNAPIFQTSTFVFDSIEHVQKVMSFESDDYVYTRGNNPTLRAFEEKMTALECGKGAVAFSSGMGAISAVLLSLLKPNDRIVFHKVVYGSAYSFMTEFLKRYDIVAISFDLTDLKGLSNTISQEDVKVIYLETPANPNLDIIDISAVVAVAETHGCKVVVDNTFATPYLQQPLNLGVDVVIHSATKYIGGHGDVVAGVAISSDIDYIHRLKFGFMCEIGSVLSPFNAWLLMRGLKTLPVRMERHCENALKVARFLEAHPKVKRVMYPGLESDKGHELAKQQMKGFGGIVSFEISGSHEDAIAVINRCKLAKIAVSLGDTETLIQLPAAMTHLGYSDEALAEIGLSKSLVRMSIGLETVEDIIEDLEKALV